MLQSAFIFDLSANFHHDAQLPLNLLSGWYRAVVLLNPITYILE